MSARIVRRATLVGAFTAAAATLFATVVPMTTASADPTANDWLRLRTCESSNNYSINTGNGYYGAYQFNLATWQSVGGTGYPNQASPAEQDARALILYRERGWEPWTCAGIVGLQDDADAGSGRINDIQLPSADGGGTSTPPAATPPAATPPAAPAPAAGAQSAAPPWPNTQYWNEGDNSSTIARWQAQMHVRGASITGTGDFGPNTLAVVKSIQAQNGLPQTGLLGPVTWKLAWTGKYAVGVSTASAGVPPWPNTQYWNEGDHSATIAQWQAQMHVRGASIVGTGDFGPNTLAVVKRIQAENGLPQTGLLGPVTWKLAWTGIYH